MNLETHIIKIDGKHNNYPVEAFVPFPNNSNIPLQSLYNIAVRKWEIESELGHRNPLTQPIYLN